MTDVLVADYAIRQLHARYVDAAWRKDVEALMDCFTEDAEWKIAGMHLHGRDLIGRTFKNLISTSERILMLLSLPVLQIGEGTASGRIYVTEIIKRPDGTAARTIGIYDDRYVGEGLTWRFLSRHWTIAYRGPADFSAPILECPDPGPLGAPRP